MSKIKRIGPPTTVIFVKNLIYLVLSARWDREQFTPCPNKALSDGPIRTLSSKHKTNWNFKVRGRPLIITPVKEDEQCCLWLQHFKILICACVQRNTLFQNKRMDPIFFATTTQLNHDFYDSSRQIEKDVSISKLHFAWIEWALRLFGIVRNIIIKLCKTNEVNVVNKHLKRHMFLSVLLLTDLLILEHRTEAVV